MIEADTKLRAARGLAKSETQAATEALSQLKRRGHPEAPPPVVSDGCGGYREALVEVWGKVPPYRGRGRPPTKKRSQAGWRYLQMVKEREKTGRVCGVKAKIIYGDGREVRELLGESTSCVYRTHLTSRHMNGRLVRKTLGYSKELQMLRAALRVGGHGIQPGTGAQNAAGAERGGRPALEEANSDDGRGADGSYLDDRGATDRTAATYAQQHLIGRLPKPILPENIPILYTYQGENVDRHRKRYGIILEQGSVRLWRLAS